MSFYIFRAWSLIRKNKHDLIHAREEAVFFAMFFKKFYKIPYAYDLDSSIAQQMIEQLPRLSFLACPFNFLKRRAIGGALINFPVCNAVRDLCERSESRRTVTLCDISPLENPDAAGQGALREEFNIRGRLVLYVGNLQPYQGIDLLLESFQIVCQKTGEADLLIVGGVDDHIAHYREKARKLEIAGRTHFAGPRNFRLLGEILAEADILACPRIRGTNTPMKIFSYLHTGKAVLATDLPTHNQILTSEETCLAPADPEGYAAGMLTLIEDESLREQSRGQGR